jgi:hypothetical protein
MLSSPGSVDTSVELDESVRLIASNKVAGSSVYNAAGEQLGTIYNLMIDKFKGNVAYAVMNFGGFLGIGESYYPLPWKALTYDTSLGGYVVDIDRQRLTNAPRYGREEDPFRDPDYGRRIYDYYNIPWYI